MAYCRAHPDKEYVAYDGKIHDCDGYLDIHPGGRLKLEVHKGGAIDDIFKAQGHSESALRILKSFKVVGVLSDHKE